MDRESSPDDVEMPRPKAKRGRPPSGSTTAPQKATALTLFGTSTTPTHVSAALQIRESP